MASFEYRVVPAPRRGIKAKGAKSAEERFAFALAEVMNALGAEGWDYVRSDMLPCEERQGLTGKATVYHTMLVFRRELAGPPVVTESRMPLVPAAAAPGYTVPAPSVLEPELAPAPPLGPAAGRLSAD